MKAIQYNTIQPTSACAHDPCVKGILSLQICVHCEDNHKLILLEIFFPPKVNIYSK